MGKSSSAGLPWKKRSQSLFLQRENVELETAISIRKGSTSENKEMEAK